jgi:DNA-binding response OmpR family regulator
VADVLLATDADWIADEVEAALGGDQEIVRVRRGADVGPAVAAGSPKVAILDLQIGNMGGMATCMHLHLEAGAGRLPRVPVLMLLDRDPDVFLARRSEADGWMVKPIDAFRLRRAVGALLAGDRWTEGDPAWAAPLPAAFAPPTGRPEAEPEPTGSLATDPA